MASLENQEVFIGNLPKDWSASQLKTYCEPYGLVLRVFISTQKTPFFTQSSGTAFVLFANLEDARKFCSSSHTIEGNQIKTGPSKQKKTIKVDATPAASWRLAGLEIGTLIGNQFVSNAQLIPEQFHQGHVTFNPLNKSVEFHLGSQQPVILLPFQRIGQKFISNDSTIFHLECVNQPRVLKPTEDRYLWKAALEEDEPRLTLLNSNPHSFLEKLQHCNTFRFKTYFVPPQADFATIFRYFTFQPLQAELVTFDTSLISKIDLLLQELFDYEIFYRLKVLLSWKQITYSQLDSKLIDFLKTQAHSNPSKLTKVLSYLFQYARYPFSVIQNPEEKIQSLLKKEMPSIPSDLVKRIMVTPLAIYYMPPEREQLNRVLRIHKKELSDFVRVSFAEEHTGPLPFIGREENISNMIRSILDKGLTVGSKNYQFLIYSSSQLRTCDCWFKHSEGGISNFEMLQEFGKFDQIKVVSKYAARIGQCFSTTSETLTIEPNKVIRIDDILSTPPNDESSSDLENCTVATITPELIDKLAAQFLNSPQKQKNFTDGIGQISSDLAELVAQKLKCNTIPSAFQIRFGGCKGVLSLNPLLPPSTIALRPSMEKFSSNNTALEICSYAKPLPAYLNRQIINLLNGLGIETHVFIQKQSKEVELIEQMSKDRQILTAQLKKYGSRYDETAKLLKHFPLDERFFREVIYYAQTRALRELREKGRILLEKGRVLMGVIDETGTLEYGQVFIQLGSVQKEEYTSTTIEGPVVITKNPCLHPGDCRRLEAVSVPQLAHLVNVLVFPAKGPRPHTDECSGSDLDGDLYFVTWDEDLIIPKNATPSDYFADTPDEVNDVTEESLKNYFVYYHQNESLGVIANSHLAISDSQGIFSREAVELAELHSRAVDFPKSGKAVKLPKHLRTTEYPDFMGEKKGKISYASQTALGHLWRLAQPLEITKFDTTDAQLDEQLCLPGHQEFLRQAKDEYFKFRSEMKSLLRYYGIKNELELVHCDLLTSHYKKYSDFESQVRYTVNETVEYFQSSFWEEFKGKELEEQQEQICKKASAYYVACYQSQGKKFCSFPWLVVGRVLCSIKSGQEFRYSKPWWIKLV